MRQILSTYKDRLVNISGRNRSLILRKIYDKRSFDLVEGLQKQNLPIDSLIDYLLTDESKRFCILEDPIKFKKTPVYEEVEALSKQFNYMYREAVATEKETGKWELYIGYPFIEGRFSDSSFVRAPFFLFPVEVEYSGNKWYISNNPYRDPMINKVFLFAAGKCHKAAIKDYSLFDFEDINREGLYQYIEQELDQMGMVLSSITSEYKALTAYTNATLPEYGNGELNLIPYLVVGQFPISNSIYSDYEALEEQTDFNPSFTDLLLNEEPKKITQPKPEQNKEALYTIAPIDYSQEMAIRELRHTNQLVIYGPPGTGKSQTISNLISHALAKGEKVMVVSQKRAALDVIYNRLATIQDKLMMIHDANKDKKLFFDKLRLVTERDYTDYSVVEDEQFRSNQKRMEEQIQKLELIETELTRPRDNGLSLQEMLAKTSEINSQQDERYPYYRKYLNNPMFTETKYGQLSEAAEMIRNNPQFVEQYRQYRELIQKYAYLPYISRPLSFMEIDRLEKLGIELIDNKNQIEPGNKEVKDILKNQYTFDILVISPDKLKELAQEYNQFINGGLVEKEKIEWWNIGKKISYGLNKKQREENEQSFKQLEQQQVEIFSKLGKQHNQLFGAARPMLEILEKEGREALFQALKHPIELEQEIEVIIRSLRQQANFQAVSVGAMNLSPIARQMIDYAISEAGEERTKMLDWIPEFTILWQINEIQKTAAYQSLYTELLQFEEIIGQIKKLSDQNESLVANIVKTIWDAKSSNYSGSAVFKELKRQGDKKRKLWPIRNMIQEFQEHLFTLFPCWLMSPETVSDILPLKSDLFDIIIFDEASQMFVENAIPTIYRGRKIVIAGDDKQLRPTSTFLSRLEEEEEEELAIDVAAALEEESLLDLAKINYAQVYLNYHYRAAYEELIQFSNYAFYNAGLNIAPNRLKQTPYQTPPIERIKVEGQWRKRTNVEEARKVVELVADLLKNRLENETLGIITFNITQKDLIEDLLEEYCLTNQEFEALYAQESVRKKDDEDKSIFVKNIENVQGDERDIIIFSVGYAPNQDGKVSHNFGSLSQDGGENRLNVAISRAKRKCYVVTSIEPEQLSVENTKNKGAKLFKEFLNYAKQVSDGQEQRKHQILQALTGQSVEGAGRLAQDRLVEQIYDRLRSAGQKVEKNVGTGKYRLDIGILDEETGEFVLGIECDTALYQNRQSLIERDIYRNRFYQARKWKIHRVWAFDWWRDSEKVIQQIMAQLNQS